MRILVIEDEPKLSQHITKALTRHNHEPSARFDGAEGLEAALLEWPISRDELLLQQVQAVLSDAVFDLYQGEASRAFAKLQAMVEGARIASEALW